MSATRSPGEFAGPQSGRVGGHEQGAVLGGGGNGEQPHQFVVVQDLGQLRGLLGAGHVQVGIRQSQGDAIEETDGMASGVAARPGQSALLVQVNQVVLNLPGIEAVRTLAVVASQSL